MVKFETPGDVGVPVMIPVEPRVRRGGKEPAVTCQRYGGMPPLALSVCE
jgi:hypothetical protein